MTLRHPIAEAIQISGGRYFWPLNPDDPGDIDIEFIAHSLSLQCRWNGVPTNLKNGAPLFYSVAQHSVIVADLVNIARTKLVPDANWDALPSPALYGLLHDASEAYLCDIPRPLKGRFTGYYGFEARLMEHICRAFNVQCPPEVKQAVKLVDDMMIFWERDALIGKPEAPYGNEADHPGTSIHDVVPEFYCWTPAQAKKRFIEKFYEINATNGNHTPLEYLDRGFAI